MHHGPVPPHLGAARLDEVHERVQRPPPASPRWPGPPAPTLPPRLHGLSIHAHLARDPLHSFPARQPRHDLPHHVLSQHPDLRRVRTCRRRAYGAALCLHIFSPSHGRGEIRTMTEGGVSHDL